MPAIVQSVENKIIMVCSMSPNVVDVRSYAATQSLKTTSKQGGRGEEEGDTPGKNVLIDCARKRFVFFCCCCFVLFCLFVCFFFFIFCIFLKSCRPHKRGCPWG